jgi:hypothetical protein
VDSERGNRRPREERCWLSSGATTVAVNGILPGEPVAYLRRVTFDRDVRRWVSRRSAQTQLQARRETG